MSVKYRDQSEANGYDPQVIRERARDGMLDHVYVIYS